MEPDGDLRERWWNGTWGRLARLDLYLYQHDTRWCIHVREGGAEGRTRTLEYDNEPNARGQLALLMTEYGPWKQIG